MWTRYRVHWDFLTKLCGQTPADPEVIAAWLSARRPKVRPPGGRSIEEIQEEVVSSLQEPESEFSGLVFAHDPQGRIAMRASTVRAHLKDCARVISSLWVGRIEGERALSTRVINGVYPDDRKHYWIPILRPDGTELFKADGEEEKPIHARGPRGEPLNALKRYEYVEPARMDFDLLVLGGHDQVHAESEGDLPPRGGRKERPPARRDAVSQSDLEHIMRYGGVHGYAGERSAGEGRYTFEIVRVDE